MSPLLSGSAGSLHFSIKNYFLSPWSMTTAHKLKGRTAVVKKSASHLFHPAFPFSHLEALLSKVSCFLFTCSVYFQSSVVHLLQGMVSTWQRLFVPTNQGDKAKVTIYSPVLCLPSSHLVYHLQNHIIFGDRIGIENNQS